MTLASSPPTGMSGSGGFGMRSSRSSSCGLDLGELGVERRDPLAGRGRRGPQVGDLGAVGRGAALDRLADPLRGRVALGLERLALAEQRGGARRRARARDRRAPGPRPCRSRPRGWRPAPRGAAAARRSCRASDWRGRPASRSRSIDERRIEARQQPAGARPVRPAEEREVDAPRRRGRPAGRSSVAAVKIARLPGVAAGRRRRRRRASASAARNARWSGRRGRRPRRAARRAGRRAARAPARTPRASARAAAIRSSRIARSRSVSGAPLLRLDPRRDVDARDLDEQREVREGRPEGAPPRPRRPRPGRAASSGTSPRSRAAISPLTSRPAVAAANRSNSSNRRGTASVPSGSNSMAWFGRGRRNRKRSCSGGMTSAIVCAAAPRPLEVDIFLPPMLRNSYGTLSGGSRSNTSRAIASRRSREPPAVERSLPHGSMVTPKSDHWAAHSRFQGSFAAPAERADPAATCRSRVAHVDEVARGTRRRPARRPSRSRSSCRPCRSSGR